MRDRLKRQSRRGCGRRSLGPLLLGILACAVLPVTGRAAPALVVVSGASPYAACAGALAPLPATNTETEPRLAIDPSSAGQRMVGVWIQDSQLGDVASYSVDGGATWHETPLPFSRCAPRGLPYDRAVDPWISVGPDGTAYATGLAVGRGVTGAPTAAVVAAISHDGGATWSAARTVRGTTAGRQTVVDKPMVLADPVRPGTAYAVWQESPGNGTSQPAGWFARTTNWGKTWGTTRTIVRRVHGSGAYWHELVEAPRSHILYDVFNLVRPRLTYRTVCTKRSDGTKSCHTIGTPVPGTIDGFIAVVKSTDRGITWSKPSIVADDLSLGIYGAPGGPLTVGSGIDAAVDPRSGRVYIVWTDARFNQLRYDQVVMSWSRDGGAHWAAPQPVSNQATSFDPVIAVSAAGTVGVAYYDLRDVGVGTTTIPTDVWFASSRGGGTPFTHETLLGQFDMKTAPFLQGYFVGDYIGLAAAGSTFRPFYVMTTGKPDNPTDVYIGTGESG